MDFVPNVVFLSATIADICTTLLGLGLGCFETNPLVASVGWINVLVGKVIATLFVVFVLRTRRERMVGVGSMMRWSQSTGSCQNMVVGDDHQLAKSPVRTGCTCRWSSTAVSMDGFKARSCG